MKKSYLEFIYSDLMSKYRKFSSRLQKNLASGKFWTLSTHKRQELLARIEKLRRRLEAMNPKLAGAMLATGFMLTTGTAMAQANFVQQTGTNNPASVVTLNNNGYGAPIFADIDADGDKDMLVGDSYDGVQYFKNTGSKTAAVFTAVTGTSNPFDGIGMTGYAVPSFGDLDKDGDFDLILGTDGDSLAYFKNTGTATSGVFAMQTGTNHFLPNIPDAESLDELAPSFVDIDGDGDLDVVFGEEDYSSIYLLKNTGTATAPNFVYVGATATDNPFAAVNPFNSRTEPGFGDIDKDGDIDAWVGGESYTIVYLRNDGTKTAPNFVKVTGTGTNNPFANFSPNGYANAAFVDIDFDGDNDYFVGQGSGISFFKNTDPTVGTTATQVANINHLVSVFPNPAKDQLQVSINDNTALNPTATMLNSKGVEVLKYNASGSDFTLNIAGLEAGVYILKLSSDQNVAVVKVVKE